MKKILVLVLGLAMLAGLNAVQADTPAGQPVKHLTKKPRKNLKRIDPYKNRKTGGKGSSVKPDLNPQPLPPGSKAPSGGGGKTAQ